MTGDEGLQHLLRSARQATQLPIEALTVRLAVNEVQQIMRGREQWGHGDTSFCANPGHL